MPKKSRRLRPPTACGRCATRCSDACDATRWSNAARKWCRATARPLRRLPSWAWRLGGDRTGIPFSGDRSGTLLRLMIARANLGRVFITNLVRCNPRDGRGRNRDPSAREIANCREHLAAELEVVRPRIVVCLGAVAWREIAGREAPFRPRRPGAINNGDGVLLYPMYHPAYVVRGAYPAQAYARDFMRLGRLLRPLAASRRRTDTPLAGRFPAPVQPRTDSGMIF